MRQILLLAAVWSTSLPLAAAPQVAPATPAQSSAAQGGSAAAKVVPLPSGPEHPMARMSSRWVVALSRGTNGQAWVGTEDDGVWRYDPAADDGKSWTRFSTKEGLGDDNAYAIACDQQGRIWVGNLNHGVSVFNGKEWKNFDVMTGPLGERVFDIKVSPVDGDVWIATDAGITRYRVKEDTWQYYTRNEGLPSDQISALSFDDKGILYVGTQCDGLAIGSAADNYSKWRYVSGPSNLPITDHGTGLPSALINDVLVAKDGRIYVATPHGLGFSRDSGQNWQYLRGRDWSDKVSGQFENAIPEGNGAGTLAEDYVTCMAEDEAGRLWIGHRHSGGYEVWDTNAGRQVHNSSRDKGKRDVGDYVKAFLLWPGAEPGKNVWVGRYMDGTRPDPLPGLTSIGFTTSTSNTPQLLLSSKLPSPVSAPDLAELNTMLAQMTAAVRRLQYEPDDAVIPPIAALDDDWKTQGTWIDRYGRYSAVLCAMAGGGNDLIAGYEAASVEHRAWIGRNQDEKHGVEKGKTDQLRYWVHWTTTTDTRALQNPSYGGRKQSEWDDHGEAYPRTLDGPNVYTTLKMPPGRYELSLYFFNKDGKLTGNRYRDYIIEVKQTPMSYQTFAHLGLPGVGYEQEFEKLPAGAQSRVSDFSGGVYKRFIINAHPSGEPNYVTVRVKRNGSLNTILMGVFLDRLDSGESMERDISSTGIQDSLTTTSDVQQNPSLTDGSLQLLNCLTNIRNTSPHWYLLHNRQYVVPFMRLLLRRDAGLSPLVARMAKEVNTSSFRPDIATCLNDLHLFEFRDRVFFDPGNYLTYAWEQRSKFGPDWNWDEAGYTKFVSQKLRSQEWQ